MNTTMRKLAPLLLAPLMMLAACDKDKVAGTTPSKPAGQPGTTTPGAENTRMNVRDRDKTAITPMDQSNSAADLDTTQRIRKAIMDDESLSNDAKNSKIITANGVVTLRGPVKSEAERKSIEAKAMQLAGNNRVENLLEVETPE